MLSSLICTLCKDGYNLETDTCVLAPVESEQGLSNIVDTHDLNVDAKSSAAQAIQGTIAGILAAT